MLGVSLALVAGPLLVATSATASSARAAGPYYYLSLGDSLATGAPPYDGYSGQVVNDLASKVTLTLENFGCSGATTGTILTQLGCSGGEAPDGVPYTGETQVGAAVAFIEAHPDQVKLITVDIGANDYAGCVVTIAPPASCVAATLPTISSNIANLAAQLRKAAGPSTVILGMTDFVDALAYWVNEPDGKALAKDWIAEFRDTLIPTLTAAYATANVPLVNIVADSGSYLPLTKLVTYHPYGRIPLAIARGCELVYMCETDNANAHPTNAGYLLMAREVARAYLAATA